MGSIFLEGRAVPIIEGFPTSGGSVTWDQMQTVANNATGRTTLTTAEVATLMANVTEEKLRNLAAASGVEVAPNSSAELIAQIQRDLYMLASGPILAANLLPHEPYFPDEVEWQDIAQSANNEEDDATVFVSDAAVVGLIGRLARRQYFVLAANTGGSPSALTAMVHAFRAQPGRRKPPLSNAPPPPERNWYEIPAVLALPDGALILWILRNNPTYFNNALDAHNGDVRAATNSILELRKVLLLEGGRLLPSLVIPPAIPILPGLLPGVINPVRPGRPQLPPDVDERGGAGRVGAVVAPMVVGQLPTLNLGTRGTILLATNFTLSAGWGTGAAVSALSPITANLNRFRLTITAGTLPSANPLITLTPPSDDELNSFITELPMLMCRVSSSDVTVTPGSVHAYWAEDDDGVSVMKLQYTGTPTASKPYIFDLLSVG